MKTREDAQKRGVARDARVKGLSAGPKSWEALPTLWLRGNPPEARRHAICGPKSQEALPTLWLSGNPPKRALTHFEERGTGRALGRWGGAFRRGGAGAPWNAAGR